MNRWLTRALESPDYRIEAASSDASFRRYYRVWHRDATYILMDAPPDKEDCAPFIKVARTFADAGLNVPRVLHADPARGLLLITDLGRRTYLDAMDGDNYPRLYEDALNALFRLQTRTTRHGILPDYSHAAMMSEMGLFRDWLLGAHLDVHLDGDLDAGLTETFTYLAAAAMAQPRVWVHRDYHSRNLIAAAADNPGILDFQDAVVGPVTYDLVSLLRDCYVKWPGSQVERWLSAYHDRILRAGVIPEHADLRQFRVWFDLMGVQRHLKAAGIFARLHHRDGKAGYLKDLPRTLGYVREVCPLYPQLESLNRILTRHVLPRLETVEPRTPDRA